MNHRSKIAPDARGQVIGTVEIKRIGNSSGIILSKDVLARMHVGVGDKLYATLTPDGGASGLRDEGMLESALDRPKNRWSYEQAELAELAAAYAFGLARNHPFIDGNKRTSLLALYTFLGVNGVDFIVPEAEAAPMILSLAAGQVSEEGLTRWIRDNWPVEAAE